MQLTTDFAETSVSCGALRLAASACLCGLLIACSTAGTKTAEATPGLAEKGDRVAAENTTIEKTPAVRRAGSYLVGKAYQVAGRWFEPKEDPTYDRIGVASWYGAQFQGRRTANGEVFDRAGLTAAHPTLPLPSYVRVTNLQNDRSVVVRVNDRGPFSRKRLIDVSERTAELLDFKRRGMAQVRVEYVDRAAVEGRDTEFLLASYQGPTVALADASPPPRAAGTAKPREAISLPGHLPPPRKAPPKPQPELAFDAQPAQAGPAPISEAVYVLGAPASPEDRIMMAFETVSSAP